MKLLIKVLLLHTLFFTQKIEAQSDIFDKLSKDFYNKDLSVNEYITSIGKFFIGTPYIASTLEINDAEKLVINLNGMDCVTFVEYVTALALCFSQKEYDFGCFVEKLILIRYKSGIIAGYPSRLHYFTDWLQDNSQKGIISIVSNRIGNAEFDNKVDFMTSNYHLYKQLKDTALFGQMKDIEAAVSAYSMKYITKDHIKNIENEIFDGDIIALATSIKGLDISHVGFAVWQNGKLHFLHASTTNKKVEITASPLIDYLQKRTGVTGILVGRIK